jgi:OCT family organic cation transporter-like MFS transporter 4/5
MKKNPDISAYIGEMGIYQWRVFIAVFVFGAFAVDSIHIVFIGASMDHWCRIPELENLPYGVQKNVAIPPVVTSSGDSMEYSKCEMYALNYSSYNESEFVTWNRSIMATNDTQIVDCVDWTYDQSMFTSTIMKKFNLVCGWDFLKPLVSTAFMAGVLVGAVTSGDISDRFGRKKTMLSFSGVRLVGNIMSIFSAHYIPLVIGRFLMGCGLTGYYLPSFVLLMELVGRNYRTALGTAIQIAFSVGYMLQPLIAYGLRDEFRYQIAATAPTFVFPFVVLWLIPESPRWLAVHGRFDEISKLVEKICHTNGLQLSKDFDPTSFLPMQSNVKRKNCSALMSSRVMRIRTLIIDMSWFTCSLIYYALALNTGTLHGDIYLNTFISGAVEIPAYICSILMMDWKVLGRRWTGCIGLVGAGVSSFLCIPMIIFYYVKATVVLAMFGKAFICIAYSVVYVYASEIFPTEVRNIGVGTASMFARISSMAAHYVGGPLAISWKPLPSLLFGIFATVAGLSYAFMPETLGQVLPDTIEQAEKFSRRPHDKTNGRLHSFDDCDVVEVSELRKMSIQDCDVVEVAELRKMSLPDRDVTPARTSFTPQKASSPASDLSSLKMNDNPTTHIITT